MKFQTDYQALCHHWVYNDDHSECYGNRMFSENDKIYSYGYHFLAAQKVRNKKGEVIAYAVNSYGYSVTTAKQMSFLRSAIPNWETVIHIPGADIKRPLRVIDYYIRKITELMEKAKKARTRTEEYEDAAQQERWELEKYINVIAPAAGVKIDKRTLSPLVKELISVGIPSHEEIERMEEKRLKAKIKAERRKNRERYQKQLANLELWKKGETRYIECGLIPEAHLRVNGEYVETSKSARVTIKAAKVLWLAIKAGKSIKGMDVDGYTAISLNGTLQIGCHHIPRKEVERIGAILDEII